MDTIECGPFLMDPTPFMRVQFIHLFSELGGKKRQARASNLTLALLMEIGRDVSVLFRFSLSCRKVSPKKKLPLDINLIHF